jgi:hypothetical protein
MKKVLLLQLSLLVCLFSLILWACAKQENETAPATIQEAEIVEFPGEAEGVQIPDFSGENVISDRASSCLGAICTLQFAITSLPPTASTWHVTLTTECTPSLLLTSKNLAPPCATTSIMNGSLNTWYTFYARKGTYLDVNLLKLQDNMQGCGVYATGEFRYKIRPKNGGTVYDGVIYSQPQSSSIDHLAVNSSCGIWIP